MFKPVLAVNALMPIRTPGTAKGRSIFIFDANSAAVSNRFDVKTAMGTTLRLVGAG